MTAAELASARDLANDLSEALIRLAHLPLPDAADERVQAMRLHAGQLRRVLAAHDVEPA